MSEPNDPILDKIRKLLAQAESPAATEAEAEAFTAKATELLAKYGIDQAVLDATRPGTERQAAADRKITLRAPFALDKAGLLNAVAEPMGCKTILLSGQRGTGQQVMHLFGFSADLDAVEVLFTSLLVQAAHSLARVPGSGNQAAAYRRSWLAGYGRAIRNRLEASTRRARQQAEEERPASAPSTDLVLADRKSLVDRKFADLYPRVRTTTRTLSGGGYGAGSIAGQNADLGGTRVGGRSRAGIGN